MLAFVLGLKDSGLKTGEYRQVEAQFACPTTVLLIFATIARSSEIKVSLTNVWF